MTERELFLKRLIVLNRTFRDLAEWLEEAADLADSNDGKGLALSCLLLKEAILAYGKELNRYAKNALDE